MSGDLDAVEVRLDHAEHRLDEHDKKITELVRFQNWLLAAAATIGVLFEVFRDVLMDRIKAIL